LIKQLFPDEDLKITALAGGDINEVYLAQNRTHQIVAKINDAVRFPEMLIKEANGLQALDIQEDLSIPVVREVGVKNDLQYLVMEYVVPGESSPTFWHKFGTGLAQQHKKKRTLYGFDEDNFIGSLVQSNKSHATWADFLVNERFLPQIKLAVDNDQLTLVEAKRMEAFCGFVGELWPEEAPALLHGDLWSGNFIVGQNDQPFLIDPAVYYGHREMDIGMMQLFGGFDTRLFDAYNTMNPLEKGWKERVSYNQLYPLLVHLNLFGRTYFQQIDRIIQPFS
jgi:fructosamine-3-kinase